MPSFLERYEKAAMFGKALEMRWFGEKGINNDSSNEGQMTSMPFLRRNLRYSRFMVLRQEKDDIHNENEKTGSPSRRQKLQEQSHSRSKLYRRKGGREMNLLGDIFTSKYRNKNKKSTAQGKPYTWLPSAMNFGRRKTTSSNPSAMENNYNKKAKLKLGETPTLPKHAFLFFCEANRRKREEELVEIWNEQLSIEEKNYWIWREIQDRRRYLHERKLLSNGMFNVQKGYVIFYYFSTKDDTPDAEENYASPYTSIYADTDATSTVQVQVEKRKDRRCPFCFYNGVNNRGLLLHCKTVHGDDGEIIFDAGIDAKNNLHMTVKNLKDKRHENITKRDDTDDDNFVFLWRCRYLVPSESDGNGKENQNEGIVAKAKNRSKLHYFDEKLNLKIPFVKRPTNLTCGMETIARKRKIRQLGQQQRLLQYQNQHQKALSEYIGDDQVPIRQYFHSRTMQPMAPGDWDVDSDDDADDEWLHTLGESLMNELGDVSNKEKKFMNMWNRFMRSHTLVGDHVLPRKCEEFLSIHMPILTQHDLRQQFMLHLFNLWDNSLLPSSGLTVLMQRYDAYALDKKKNQNVTDTGSSDKGFDDDENITSQSSLKRKRSADGHSTGQAKDDDNYCDAKVVKASERQQALDENTCDAKLERSNEGPIANSKHVTSLSSDKSKTETDGADDSREEDSIGQFV